MDDTRIKVKDADCVQIGHARVSFNFTGVPVFKVGEYVADVHDHYYGPMVRLNKTHITIRNTASNRQKKILRRHCTSVSPPDTLLRHRQTGLWYTVMRHDQHKLYVLKVMIKVKKKNKVRRKLIPTTGAAAASAVLTSPVEAGAENGGRPLAHLRTDVKFARVFIVLNTHLLFKTYIYCSKHIFTVQNIHLLFKTYIYCSKHIFTIQKIHLLFKTYIYCPKHIFTVQNIYLLFKTYIYCSKHAFTVHNIYLLFKTNLNGYKNTFTIANTQLPIEQ